MNKEPCLLPWPFVLYDSYINIIKKKTKNTQYYLFKKNAVKISWRIIKIWKDNECLREIIIVMTRNQIKPAD